MSRRLKARARNFTSSLIIFISHPGTQSQKSSYLTIMNALVGAHLSVFHTRLLPATLTAALHHSPGSSIQDLVHFLPFIKRFRNFSFFSEATKSQFYFSVEFGDLLLSFGNFPILLWYIFEVTVCLVSRICLF